MAGPEGKAYHKFVLPSLAVFAYEFFIQINLERSAQNIFYTPRLCVAELVISGLESQCGEKAPWESRAGDTRSYIYTNHCVLIMWPSLSVS